MKIDWENKLEGLGKKRSVLQGETLFYLEEEANTFYLLLSGQISLYKLNQDGKETTIRKVIPGEIFAEVMVFTDSKYPVGASVDKDSMIIEYAKKEILLEIKKDNELSMFFIKVLSQRCLMLNEKIYQFSLQDVSSRLASFILQYIADNNLLEKAELAEPIEMTISKKEIATSIGTIPETLSRNFQKLHQLGILKVFGKTVVVQNFAKLRNLAGT